MFGLILFSEDKASQKERTSSCSLCQVLVSVLNLAQVPHEPPQTKVKQLPASPVSAAWWTGVVSHMTWCSVTLEIMDIIDVNVIVVLFW